MKKCTLLVVVLLMAFAANIFAQSNNSVLTSEINPASLTKLTKSQQTPISVDALGDLLRNYNIDSLTPGSAAAFGVVWTGSYYIVSEFNTNKFFRFTSNWAKIDSFSVTGSTGLFRDMAFAKGLLWGVNVSGQIFGVDTATKTVVKTITTSLASLRALCWDPYRNGFWVGTNSFTGPLVCVDTNGVTIAGASITTPASGLYSVGYEDGGSQATSFLWIGTDQTPTSATGTALIKYNAQTLAVVGSPLNITVPLTTGAPLASGGGEVYNTLVPGKRVWLGIVQGSPDRVITVELSVLPAPPSKVLVITNDSTTPTIQRISDRDTLKKYVAQLVGGTVDYMTKNTTTVFPDLSSYTTIIFQETAFDATAVRSLVAAQRQALKDWLSTGTASAKKSLIMIGGDLGYAYDQTGQSQLDTVFSRSFGGYQYVTDNGAPIANAFVGKAPGTVFDALSTAPPGGSYWPDGCRPISGGQVFNVYKFKADTIAGVSKTGAGWNVVSTFQDPRYYTGAGDSTGDIGFKRVLKNLLAFVRTSGGVVTNVTPVLSTVAENYSLSQNYPNPFNPTTNINFAIPQNGFVSLKVYDISGKEVMTLVNKNMNVGSYSVEFNGSYLSSGVYFYRLESGNFVETKKMMLVK